jgi:NAD(P)-dependent dehydrogenase (short-subunit alcohol dehydrogenase family)
MMARALALNGALKVYIVGRRKEVLEKASKSVSTNNIIPLVGDVTSKEALASIVSQIASEVGYINVLIANSGTLGPQPAQKITSESTVADYQKAWGETSFEDFADTFKLNTVAVVGVGGETLSYLRLFHEIFLRQCPLPKQSQLSNC